MIFGFFVDVAGILYTHIRFYHFHQNTLLCDDQELACTPKDSPRRVDMNARSIISFHKKIDWAIDQIVWKLTLVEPFENRSCALISWYICSYIWMYLILYLNINQSENSRDWIGPNKLIKLRVSEGSEGFLLVARGVC